MPAQARGLGRSMRLTGRGGSANHWRFQGAPCMAGQPRGATRSAKPGEVAARWIVVDAKDAVLGRLASRVAMRLRGTHHARYTPHADTGDFVVIVNAEKIRLTGRKREDKIYYKHTG